MKTNINDLILRQATEEDIQQIFDYIMMMAIYEKLEDEVTATPELVKKSIFEQHAAEVFMVEFENKIVGLVLLTITFSTFVGKPTLYVEDIILEESVRGKGFGTSIFIALAQLALDRGYGRMDWMCLDWNKPSIEFYKKMGGKPLEDWITFRLDEPSLKELVLK